MIEFDSPDRDQPGPNLAPILYGCLQQWHLQQVHDLLARVFWAGIDGNLIPFLVLNQALDII